MWKHYFGEQATVIGVDLDPRCKALEEDRVRIEIGDQGDREFWQELKSSLPVLDIIIDDGGHMMEQQRITFEEMFPVLSPHGIYLIEDLHTSYWSSFGGGYQNPDSFIEYSKQYIDRLNAWHSQDQRLEADIFTESVWSMSYYDSVLVIEKRPRLKPSPPQRGNPSW